MRCRLVFTLIVICGLLGKQGVPAGEPVTEEKNPWKFSEEEIRLFDPPRNASPEEILEWSHNLERPFPEDTSKWGGFDAYREQVMLIRLRLVEQILATDPPFELERQARMTTWFPYVILCQQDKEKYLPETREAYERLRELSQKQGDLVDERTNLYFSLRKIFLREIAEYDPAAVLECEKTLAEIDALLEKHSFGKEAESLYVRKYEFLELMAKIDSEKYREQFDAYCQWLRKFVLDNEEKLASTDLFFILYHGNAFNTAGNRKYGRELIARFRNLIDSNAETGRFDKKGLSSIRGNIYVVQSAMLFNDLEGMTPEIAEYLDNLAKEEDPELSTFVAPGYRSLWTYWLQRFSEKGGTDEELERIFYWIDRYLDTGKDNYLVVGDSFDIVEFFDPYEKCTPKQKEDFLRQFGEMLEKMEKVETEWKAAEKPMLTSSHVEKLRNYWLYKQLPGKKPELKGTTVDGKPFDVASLRGKVVLVDVWATWCGPCRREFPKIRAVYDRYKDRGFEVVTVSIDEDKAALEKFLDKEKLPWVTLYDPDCLLLQKFHQIGGAGHYFLLDRDGAVLSLDARGEKLEAELKRIFGE